MGTMADKSLKILCIDDSQMALKITRNLLEKEGHEVETLSRPEQALEKLHEVQPDIWSAM